MECLLLDKYVCICSVPHAHDLPLGTLLQGLGLGGENPVKNLKQEQLSGRERWV